MSEQTPASVRIERIFDAPIDTIWQMWTDPDHFAAWYGPPGAEVAVERWDLSVGGRRLVGMAMPTPDGSMQMWFTGEFREIDPPSLLLYTESMADADGNVVSPAEMGMPDDHPLETRVVVELATDGDRTRMVMTHEGVPADSPGAQGWTMALDELEARVVELAS